MNKLKAILEIMRAKEFALVTQTEHQRKNKMSMVRGYCKPHFLSDTILGAGEAKDEMARYFPEEKGEITFELSHKSSY